MEQHERIIARFDELADRSKGIKVNRAQRGSPPVDQKDWQAWATNVLNLFATALGKDSIHYENFKNLYDRFRSGESDLNAAKGIFSAAREDFSGGHLKALETSVSAAVLGDFVELAKEALREGHKDVAAVLACAALEDALKRYAHKNGLAVEEETMGQVVSALKSKGLVGGARKSLLDAMLKIRNFAMHSNWLKIMEADVNSVIGFVEQFLLVNF